MSATEDAQAMSEIVLLVSGHAGLTILASGVLIGQQYPRMAAELLRIIEEHYEGEGTLDAFREAISDIQHLVKD